MATQHVATCPHCQKEFGVTTYSRGMGQGTGIQVYRDADPDEDEKPEKTVEELESEIGANIGKLVVFLLQQRRR